MNSMVFILSFGGGVLALSGGLVFWWYVRQKIRAEYEKLQESQSKLKDSKRDIEAERQDAFLKLKDELYHKRKKFELELKRDRLELDRLQSKLNMKCENIEKRELQLDDLRRELQQKERTLSRAEDIVRANETKIKALYSELVAKLEQVSVMSREEAKHALADTLESEVRLASQKWVQKVEEEAKQTAKEKVLEVLVGAMQRYTADQVAPHSTGIVHLPNEDMKGRIIGKEGRNIKSLEQATGMEFIIGDSPDITISGFNPIRREVARRTLEKLISDGRINPSRIEEIAAQCEKEIEDIVAERGKEIVLEFNLQGVHPEIINLLGKLYFRTSFSQNVLQHCKEVGLFARMIAQELGLDGSIALRAGLFHDIGKSVTAEVDGPHAQLGGDIAKRCGEDPRIVNAIAAHHEEIPFTSFYAPIVLIADTVSASRPGARRETLSAYLKRLEKLEEIASGFDGVKKVFALQAGREIRILVDEDSLDDDASLALARNIARRVEKEMNFPGQIKVNVIREKRAVEYAR